MINLDHFKTVNDTLGHAAGDEVIARVGTALLERPRSADSADIAARLGGDEFAVMLRRVTAEQIGNMFGLDADRLAADQAAQARSIVAIRAG